MERPSPEIIEYNICGQVCPSTLLTTLREVNRHILGLKDLSVQLLFKTDNRNCTITIPEAVANMGLKAEVGKEDGIFTILIRKGDAQHGLH